jgi:membrane protein implicated in regulation of membrane protease activity
MFLALIGGLVWWHWLVLAMLLLVIELTVPFMWFLWVAVAAGLMTVVTALVPGLTWQWQLIAFGVLALASLFIGRQFFAGEREEHDTPGLNRRAEQHVGKVLTLVEPIVNGRGAARVGDTRWRVAGTDMPVGTQVHVTGVDGTLLTVEQQPKGDAG